MEIVIISGEDLTIGDIRRVALGATVKLSDDAEIHRKLTASRDVIRAGIARGEQIYGVTTLFGGMADQYVGPDLLEEVQRLALWQHKSTTGPRLPAEDVRAAMLLRANSLMKGASGIRTEIIERFVTFLNAGALPHVYQRGSIGASGDLVPLAYIGGAILGLDKAFLVDVDGETLDSHTVLSRLGLKPLALEPKEGLALNNGTGACTGVAANASGRALDLLALTLGIHALYAQAMLSTDQSFHPFIHSMKPHSGQVWAAQQMAELVAGSKIMRNEAAGDRAGRFGKLIQDRYSLRCLPQYLGPIVDGIVNAARQVTVEANCANDNPLIDPDTSEIFHTGNFLAQYTGVAMDQTRYFIGLLAKHIDVQIALLMTPEFSYGLNASLVGNADGPSNIGLKSLQIGGNSMMPLISFYGQSIVDRFPTHAEQFNQNINSQAMNSANLARESLDVLEHYLAVALFCGVQAVELRAKLVGDSYDARTVLSPATAALYEAARTAALGPPDAARPVHWNDFDGFIQPRIEGLLADIVSRGKTFTAIRNVRASVYGLAGGSLP
ncbi:aromatic amino acid ammonia-lyase [Novosphingobium sp. MMS21-SN21R]|uniref:HAL/PAL/TAL family ammonia-lyase n=1 Tax=Novosphingobium sp. MMS21-SN21R TaxID=2969298 RepID=UPI002886C545|nr:aromatic amino acid ammonia-lyase [Novosphingobium sp. MMS21-SN21R]MDT0508549.1 aromatic amino acid ammonia-lyase [Novosphingobium sp. MMS21-SN21R]